MKKTLLAVYATGNVGKTTSIKNFFLKFILKHSDQIKDITHFNVDEQNEIYKIIELKNGVKIGVCSFGDDGSSYEKLNNFANQDCKVIVCASRTKGASVDSINKLIEELNETNSTLKDELEKINNEIQDLNKNMNNYEIKWVHKSYLWNVPDYFEEKMLNDSFSESILEFVEYYMVQ
ncbi:MAG: hypothetical protein IIW49_01395 [Treponema sp.]|nr:hypothetical protein [Treponema sp.]